MWLIVHVWPLDIVLSNSFNHIPQLIFQDEKLTGNKEVHQVIKYTGLVVVDYLMHLLVTLGRSVEARYQGYRLINND